MSMRTLLLFALMLLTIAANAQDFIILKNGEEIKSIVKEIDLDVVRYQKFDNQTGPVYVIKKSEVFLVKYANGTKDVINAQSEAPKTQPVESVVKKKEEVSPRPKLNKDYLIDRDYRKNQGSGAALVSVGSILLMGSVPMIAMGSVFITSYETYHTYMGYTTIVYDEEMRNAGLSMLILGPATLGSSIAMIAVGAKKLNRAKDIKYGYQKAAAYINFQASPNGGKLVMQF